MRIIFALTVGLLAAVMPSMSTSLAQEEVPALIERVEIQISENAKAQLIIVSGLPDSCHEFGSYNIARTGDTLTVEVLNLKQDGGCADVYRTVETPMDIPGEVHPCQVYNVVVNGTAHRVRALAPNVRCGDFVIELAPIESVEIVLAQSLPSQYIAHVVSGLPSGCFEFDHYQLEREANTINIQLFNRRPADPIGCTREYRTIQHSINLGSDFVEGELYVVNMNDVTKTFIVQGGQVSEPVLNVPFPIRLGEKVVLEGQGLEIAFVGVIEDSRCPANVVCIWAGRAVILVQATKDGQDLGTRELILYVGSVPAEFDGYLVQFLKLDPYPIFPDPIPASDYIATLAVLRTPPQNDQVSEPTLNAPFPIKFGEKAVIESEGLEIEFVDVIEDSRCPTDVNCEWPGRAVILVQVTKDGQDLGAGELILGPGPSEDQSSAQFDGYLVKLLTLDPYPGTTGGDIQKADYIATLAVFRTLAQGV